MILLCTNMNPKPYTTTLEKNQYTARLYKLSTHYIHLQNQQKKSSTVTNLTSDVRDAAKFTWDAQQRVYWFIFFTYQICFNFNGTFFIMFRKHLVF